MENIKTFENFLWVEKYRPKTLDDFIFSDENNNSLKSAAKNWIKKGELPHLLFTGSPGTGKTSFALLLFSILQVDQSDILFINASSSRGIDTVRDNIQNFVSTMPIGKVKYILLDEADSLTIQAQLSLRSLLETYSSICRFIFTGNYENKIIQPIKSRTQHFQFKELDPDLILEKIVTILMNEGADNNFFNEETLVQLEKIIHICYPDLRKTINLLQQSWDGKKIVYEEKSDKSSNFTNIIKLFQQGKYIEGRKCLQENLNPNDYHSFYRYLYENLEEIGFKNKEDQAIAILKIAEGCKNHTQVVDQEINLSATLVNLFST